MCALRGAPTVLTTMTARSLPAEELAARVARSLVLDRLGAHAAAALRAVDVDCIVLKGPAIGGWLYDEAEGRTYGDIDLLVRRSSLAPALAALADLGYEHVLRGADPSEYGPCELELVGPEGTIDLHHHLIGVGADPGATFDALRAGSVDLDLAGERVAVLGEPARAMHLALHAIQNGPVDIKAIEDLRRGLDRCSPAVWDEAAALARALDAVPAFAAGLRLVPDGAALAERLGLTTAPTVDLAMRSRSQPAEAFLFEQLRAMEGWSPRLRLIGRKLFPTAAFLRHRHPLARRGWWGLAAVRVWRAGSVLVRSVTGFRAWAHTVRSIDHDERG